MPSKPMYTRFDPSLHLPPNESIDGCVILICRFFSLSPPLLSLSLLAAPAFCLFSFDCVSTTAHRCLTLPRRHKIRIGFYSVCTQSVIERRLMYRDASISAHSSELTTSYRYYFYYHLCCGSSRARPPPTVLLASPVCVPVCARCVVCVFLLADALFAEFHSIVPYVQFAD